MATPNFLASIIGGYEGGSRQAERNRLAELDEQGRALAGAAIGGDKNALSRLFAIDTDRGMKVQQFTDQQKKDWLETFTREAYGARTPEAWKAMIDRHKAEGRTFAPGEADFGNRDALIARGLDVAQSMGLDLRREEAKRAQGNSDRAYNLDVQQFGETRRMHDAQLAQRDKDPFAERAAAAQGQGLQPGTPEYQSFVLTGRMPNEQRSTAQDRAAIREADDAAFSAENAIGQLKQAIALNKQAGSGYFAGTQSFLARNDPTGFFDDKKGQATTEFTNLVLNQALGSLKAIFGAAPTEGERAILVELQASVDKGPQERQAILDRAVALADRRLAFQKDRGAELRGGTYYQPGGGPDRDGPAPQRQGGAANPPANADALLDQANDAIARGADPAKVRQRLLEQGVEADFDGQ